MKILSLDISSKTGWAVVSYDKELSLVESGRLDQVTNTYSEEYPESYLKWSADIASEIVSLIEKKSADIVVIEETSKGSKNAKSQKILEWVHFLVASFLIEKKIKNHYLMTGEWRGLVSARMTKEELTRNKIVKKQHATGNKVAKDESGKRIGKISKKHVNIRRANEIFNLNLKKKNEDEADAILLGVAYAVKTGYTGL